jgi:hypothetical protein
MKINMIQAPYLLPFVLVGLLAGISGGWLRLGSMIVSIPSAAANHGLLMVGVFLGTLISLERAMVMPQRSWLLVPFLAGISVIPFLLQSSELGILLLLLGSFGLNAIMHLQALKHPKFHSVLLYIGAACWFVGNFFVWQTGLIAAGTTWWIGFLMFTIVGERLELSQFLPVPKWAKIVLKILLTLFTLGLVVPFHTWGNEIMGSAALSIAIWLLYFDMAKIAARKKAQFRYIGVGLRLGYVWLGFHGFVLLFMETHALYYDLMLHTFFLGFVFSMIWAHAPIVFPTIFNLRISLYHPVLWISWSLFQLTLLGRVLFTLTGEFELRKIFGVINGSAILIQFAIMATIVIYKLRQARAA